MPSDLANLKRFSDGLRKSFGDSRLPAQTEQREILTTTSLTLDWALRIGGLEMGCLYEIVGEKDSYKTSLAIRMLAAAQQRWPNRGVAYIDLEKTFRGDWAARLGLDCSDEAAGSGRWIHAYPQDSEDASDLACKMAESGVLSLIVIDSVGGMESRKAFRKDAEEDIVGKNAQVITRMTKRLASATFLNKCTIIMINQYRANLSGYGGDLSAGPKALQYATTGKIEMRAITKADAVRTLKFGDSEEPVSRQVRARVTRLKNATPGRTAEFWFNIQPSVQYGPVGINVADEATTMGIKHGIIAQNGGWYTVPGAEKVQGREAVTALLAAHLALLETVRTGLLAGETTEVTTDA